MRIVISLVLMLAITIAVTALSITFWHFIQTLLKAPLVEAPKEEATHE
jgi:hypothetical protein